MALPLPSNVWPWEISTAPDTFTSEAVVRPIGCCATATGAAMVAHAQIAAWLSHWRLRLFWQVAAMLELEEIPHQALAVCGEHAFGVELDALNRELAVAQTHDGSS